MTRLPDPLRIVPEETIRSITRFISRRFRQLHREVAVLGLSGGLDSSLAAALTVSSLGPERVRLYYLPERDSKPLHRKHAMIIAEEFGPELKIISLTPALRSLRIYSLLPFNFVPGRKLKAQVVKFGRRKFQLNSQGEILRIRLAGSGNTWIRRANAYISAKHRLRALVLYREAERLNGMVVGAANRTEWLTGTFTHWGCDHCADIMPLLHLYRSQLEILARYLELPEQIISKKADPDVIPGLDDKEDFLGSFEVADQILWGIENGVPVTELAERFGQEKTLFIKSIMGESAYYRETPYSLF
jgi:NAD+ synthase